MSDKKTSKSKRYSRVTGQLSDLLKKTDDSLARMATVAALLHHKMDGFFWTGFYLLRDNKLIVGPYQGPVACQELDYGTGVCWAAVKRDETIVVEDVNKFPGHIACDSRSKSEIVVPVRNENNVIVAVLDVDSARYANFDDEDAGELEKITAMIFLQNTGP
jgi:L-methionine (R)-S-oxide reductase